MRRTSLGGDMAVEDVTAETQVGAEQSGTADAAWADDRPAGTVRTAVVIVHGMGEQRPMDTLDGFVKTALHPLSDLYPTTSRKWDYYYSRPAEITGSYEARRYISRPLTDKASPEPKQGQAEIYEYHWSYLMTGNKFADLGPTTLRLFLRRPRNVPDPLFGIWRVVWIALLAIPVAMAALFVGGHLLNKDVPWWILGAVSSVVVLLFWLGVLRFLVRAVVKSVTASFVDVARYLDTAPHSYAARRAIRGGLVDLLHALHDEGRYSRVVVVAHSLGAYIAYDALTSFWAEVHQLHAGRPEDETPLPIKLASLDDLEKAADRLIADDDGDALEAFQDLQFTLWQDLVRQGNPWRITDFVSVGTHGPGRHTRHPPQALQRIEEGGRHASTRTIRRTGPSRRAGHVPTTDGDVAGRGRQATQGKLRIQGRRHPAGARFAVAVRRHTLDEPVVSRDSRRPARRLVRRPAETAVRPRHPRHRGARQ